MAYAQAELGSFDESITSYQHAIELRPTYAPDAYNQIGIIQLHQGHFDLAAASFEKAMAADTGQVRTAELRNNLNYALQRLGPTVVNSRFSQSMSMIHWSQYPPSQPAPSQ